MGDELENTVAHEDIHHEQRAGRQQPGRDPTYGSAERASEPNDVDGGWPDEHPARTRRFTSDQLGQHRADQRAAAHDREAPADSAHVPSVRLLAAER